MSQIQLPTMDQLLGLMSDVLSGDNQRIQTATKYFKRYLKVVDSVAPLAIILSQNDNISLRQLSGVLLKRNILFPDLPQNQQKELQMMLVERFFLESISVIRKQIGSIIGSVAQLTLSQGKWPELMQVLGQQTDQNQPVERRQRGLELLGLILDYSGDSLKDFYNQFYGFFKVTIQDQEKNIRFETVKCLINLFDNIGYMTKEQINLYKELVAPIIQIIEGCVKDEDEETVQYCLEAFTYLADSKMTILDEHFLMIIQFVSSPNILLNNKLSKHCKECVLDLISTISTHHRSVFNKNLNILQQVVTVLCQVIATPFTEDDLDEYDESLQDVALWLMQTLTLNLNKKKIYGILLEITTKLIENGNANQQNTGFLILAQMCEGLSDQLSKNLSNPIMNILIPKGLQSQHPEVRGAASKALSYFAEYLPDEIVEYHAMIIPAMIQSYNDMSIKVAEKSLFTLDIFCDAMEDEIIPYLPIIINHLLSIPNSEKSTVMMKRAAISTIASCIASAKEGFKPFLENSYQLLHQIVQMKQLPENMGIISEAVQALGKIANIFCKVDQQVYQIVVQPCMDIIYQMLINNKDYEIREGCFSFFYNLADGLGPQFEPFFDKLIDITLEIAGSEEGVEYQKKEKGEFSLDSDSEDENDPSNVKVKSTFLEEKAAAIHALGEFAIACPMKFQNYFERSLAILEVCYNYFHDNVRQQAVLCYKLLIEGMVKCSNQGTLPKYNKGLPCTVRLPQNLENLITIEIWQKFLFYLNEEKSAQIVAITILSLEQLCLKIGPSFIDHNLDDLVDRIIILLDGQGICQNPTSDDEVEENEETEGKVFESLIDLIPALAKVLQNGFELAFQRIFNSLFAYLNQDREIIDNVQGVGCFAVTFKKCPRLIAPFVQQILPRILQMVQNGDEELNRNISYLLGLLVEKGSQVPYIQQQLPYIMQALKAIFDSSKQQATKDNSAASLCRIISTFPDQAPLVQALEQILKLCPFQGDEEEEKTVIKMLLFLAGQRGDSLQNHIEKVIELMIDACIKQKKYKIKEQLGHKIVFLLKNLASQEQHRKTIESLIVQLDETNKNYMISLMQ